MTTVTVDGETYMVAGADARARFITAMTDCGVNPAAVAAFNDWRAMRRWTNITGAAACCFFPLFATPVTAILAGEKQELFLVHMMNS